MPVRSLRLLAALALTLTTLTVASAPATAKPHRLEVVQLGDSYSAGNGAGAYTDTTCYRSPYNYGTQFARSINATYVNRACSGAVIKNVLNPTSKGTAFTKDATFRLPTQREATARKLWLRKAEATRLCGTTPASDMYYSGTVGPLTRSEKSWTGTMTCQLTVQTQVDAVTPHTDIVLLTVGGNDIGFSNLVGACLALRNAPACQQSIGFANAVLPSNTAGVRNIFEEIRQRSRGHAQVYLMPYPYLLNTDSYSIPEGAPTYDVGAALAAMQTRGNELQQDGVTAYNDAAGAGQYHWVGPVVDIWRGHGLDPHVVADNSDAWLVPLFAPGRVSAEYVHPTREGWAASATALEGYYATHH